MQAAIVETTFKAKWPGGRFRKIVVRIGQPAQAKTHEWVCPVRIIGLQNTVRVRGEDALQVLCIALDLVGDLLYEAQSKGVRLGFVSSNDKVPLYAYFRLKAMRKRMEKLGRKKVPFGKVQ